MKIALVHDWLSETRGGAELVLLRLAKLYPNANIFCLTYDKTTYPELLNRNVATSWLGRLPKFIRRRRSLLTILAPQAIESLNLTGYDLIISTSNSFAKGVRAPETTKHICYCFSPMRYVWDYWPETMLERVRNPLSKILLHWLTHRLRVWDYYSSRGVDDWIAISKTTAARIKKYYGQSSTVVYSGILDVKSFWDKTARKHDYYVTLSTLTPYKKVDLAIEACIKSNRKLMVIGDGPEANRLQKLAEGHDNIKFMGRVAETEKIQYLQESKGLIFPSEEDFGIAPLEAVAAGTPVIAFNKGGLTETIVEHKSGLFFKQQTMVSLNEALDRFESAKWDPATCHQQALPYDIHKFDTNIVAAISRLVGEKTRG